MNTRAIASAVFADFVNRVHGGINRGGETDGHVSSGQVVVNGSGYTNNLASPVLILKW